MVNIIIPAYNAHETIRQAISSVAMQDDLDNILLTIVDDYSDEPYDYLIDDFHYMNIEILRKPSNTGCGQARQYGIDRCNCEYMMFLDADDCLHSPNAVTKLLFHMEDEHLDFAWSAFGEEMDNGDYVLHENNGVWMHGKIYRTKYIKEHDIRFSETRLNEDHSFNILVVLSGGKNLYIDYITYIWKYYVKSLTRSNNFKSYVDSLEDYMINAEYAISELLKRNIEEEKIITIIKEYILSFYKYCNILFTKEDCETQLKKYKGLIRKFYINLPCNFKPKLTKEFLVENFYESDSIDAIINDNILFNMTFDNYYMIFDNISK